MHGVLIKGDVLILGVSLLRGSTIAAVLFLVFERPNYLSLMQLQAIINCTKK